MDVCTARDHIIINKYGVGAFQKSITTVIFAV
jgi:hypothetical protein